MKNEYRLNDDGTTTIFDHKKDGRVLEITIDTQDLRLLIPLKIKWHVVDNDGFGNIRVKSAIKGKKIYLSRFLTQCPDHLVVDHIDQNTLNNRRSNLRCVTHQLNSLNKNKPHLKFIYYDDVIKRYRIYVGDLTSTHKYQESFENIYDAINAINEVRNSVINSFLHEKTI